MIEITKAFKVSTGGMHALLGDAQFHEIKIAIGLEELKKVANASPDGINDLANNIIGAIVFNADKIVDILTTTESCRPKARKINGGKKTRKPKPETLPSPLPAA